MSCLCLVVSCLCVCPKKSPKRSTVHVESFPRRLHDWESCAAAPALSSSPSSSLGSSRASPCSAVNIDLSLSFVVSKNGILWKELEVTLVHEFHHESFNHLKSFIPFTSFGAGDFQDSKPPSPKAPINFWMILAHKCRTCHAIV
jgi:hypothetical protein